MANEEGLFRVTGSMVRRASQVCGRAFQGERMFISLVPDEATRGRSLPHIFEVLIRYGVLYGEVYATSEELEGVAVWLPFEAVKMSPWRTLRSGGLSLLTKVNWGVLATFQRFEAAERRTHERLASFPHWYLALIGVDPRFQGRGLAGSLLRPMLSHMDVEGVPCYLETHSQKNVAIFRHFGFRVLEEFDSSVEGRSLWAMLRD